MFASGRDAAQPMRYSSQRADPLRPLRPDGKPFRPPSIRASSAIANSLLRFRAQSTQNKCEEQPLDWERDFNADSRNITGQSSGVVEFIDQMKLLHRSGDEAVTRDLESFLPNQDSNLPPDNLGNF